MNYTILGFGGRGRNYAMLAKREGATLEAVIDISQDKLKAAKNLYNLPDDRLFLSFDEFLTKKIPSGYIFICTQDKDHEEHAIKAMRAGYDILLEKPIAHTLEACENIINTSKQTGRKVFVCYVLRYSAYFKKIKELCESGVLGELVAIEQKENVGYWHQAHSFVRGDWRNADESTPMIIAKCCHDLDIIKWLADSLATKVYSKGRLTHFKKENAPQGATAFCTGGCKAKDICPYDAEKLYLARWKAIRDPFKKWKWDCWPQSRLMSDGVVTEEKLVKAINKGQFGRCVYACDNTVVDYQTVDIEFQNGVYASLTMTAFSHDCYRELRVRGTKGEVVADMLKNEIILREFGKKEVNVKADSKDMHGGGDALLIKGLFSGNMSADVSDGLESHIIGFSAEKSRVSGLPVIIRD
ncbi:MAG: Gfo/Idh/MocA family oxidoreductase [Christensenellaceae bacterium]|jgi:predicted dehydrogenase|nr:Gfo/Idh/MocA family oxidoreductase [Christensenellaceae bacterium]